VYCESTSKIIRCVAVCCSVLLCVAVYCRHGEVQIDDVYCESTSAVIRCVVVYCSVF